MTDPIDSYLRTIYYRPESPASFSNLFALWKHVKSDNTRPPGLTYKLVRNWLKLQETHLMHSAAPARFKTEHIVTDYIDQEWQSDLIDMQKLARQNRNFKFILVVIDLFSRFIFTRAMKSKSADETGRMFQDIIDKSGRSCELLQTDQGSEYRGASFQQVLKRNNISHLLAYGPHKASICERVNRTIENRLYKYFTENATTKYIDILEDITYSINNTYHTTLKRAPASITEDNQALVYKEVYEKMVNKAATTPLHYAFNVGDLVRLSVSRTPFTRGYLEQWTQEVFVIFNRVPSRPPRYRVKDLHDEIIKGSFYAAELQKIAKADIKDIQYTIDKILSYKKFGRVQYAKIRWYGLSSSFDTFIKKSDIKKYKRIKR